MDLKRALFHRSRMYPLVLIAIMYLVYLYRKDKAEKAILQQTAQIEESTYFVLEGKTMGTYYDIRYIDEKERNFQGQIDSVLKAFNAYFSTYQPDSWISECNRSERIAIPHIQVFEVLNTSREVYDNTNGAFDPTIMPLVNAWGFGYTTKSENIPTQHQIDSLKNLVDYKAIEFDSIEVRKLEKNTMLDFSAIAKGYGVDVVANWLQSRGIENLKVDIGGELVTRGMKFDKPWRIGINDPNYYEDKVQLVIELTNHALATSGNYRNYYEVDGKRYAHTIDPRTGSPVQHNLLSVSVLAKNCMIADAYATAFMVLGKDNGIEIVKHLEDVEAYFIYDDNGINKVYATEGFEKLISGN